MFNCKSVYIIYILLVLLFSSPINAQGKSGNNITLHLVLDSGFINMEEVNIKIKYTDRDSTIFSGKLNRPGWVDDHDFYDIALEKGKLNTLTIECVSRGVSLSQGFLYSLNDAYSAYQ